MNLFDDYSAIVFEAKHTSIHGKRLNILNSIEMLQMLPIPLAKVKPGNTCEHLLNEIRQNINSLY